ncbi:dynein regulation protein LC7 [Streptomyces sp. WAC 06783]|uniref:roadblock/LC7 domain-containing protein n=1 Tax=Streptomyces sp. WAC 06783 TaxID=2203211 RepID=UPI000F74499B|nr:roadblock/LC7 domain-containing protein [Streptomyces sp. WAC 06783]RSO07033.1 dynein regulation protein LC7 [Streptomyces sp. WAC 06783]
MTTDLSWLMTSLIEQTPGVVEAMLLSDDGLKVAHDGTLDTDAVDQMAAISSGLVSLGLGFETHCAAGRLRSLTVALTDRQVVVMQAGGGANLTVLADAEADTGAIGIAMVQLVERLGWHLSVPARTAQPQTP